MKKKKTKFVVILTLIVILVFCFYVFNIGGKYSISGSFASSNQFIINSSELNIKDKEYKYFNILFEIDNRKYNKDVSIEIINPQDVVVYSKKINAKDYLKVDQLNFDYMKGDWKIQILREADNNQFTDINVDCRITNLKIKV